MQYVQRFLTTLDIVLLWYQGSRRLKSDRRPRLEGWDAPESWSPSHPTRTRCLCAWWRSSPRRRGSRTGTWSASWSCPLLSTTCTRTQPTMSCCYSVCLHDVESAMTASLVLCTCRTLTCSECRCTVCHLDLWSNPSRRYHSFSHQWKTRRLQVRRRQCSRWWRAARNCKYDAHTHSRHSPQPCDNVHDVSQQMFIFMLGGHNHFVIVASKHEYKHVR